MNSYRNSILATIVYYDIFDYPLTLLEVFKYLINPGRVKRITDGIAEITLNDIAEELDKLVKSKTISQKNGFYFLIGRESLYDIRIDRQKIADQKWKKFLKIVRFLALAPYFRGAFASGSMALGNTDDDSDFDVLVIVKAGRLYTSRLFMWLITSVMGVRRKKHERVAPDKLCFNHFITENSLGLSHESLFNAQTYANLKPIMIEPGLIDRFFSSNLWINNFVYNFKVQKDFVRRSVVPSGLFIFCANLGELILNSPLGDGFEKIAKNFQQKKIKNNPATYESGGRIVFNDAELEFHPRSFESTVVKKYNQGIRKLGLIPYIEEKDSGLTS